MMRTVLRLEQRRLLRSRGAVLGLCTLAVAGLLALGHGHTVMSRQRDALAAGTALQAEQHRAILEPAGPGARAGDQMYYLVHHTAHHPSAWAAWAIGQRDVQAIGVKVRLLALQGQLYAGELLNPVLAAAGGLDAALVLALFAPLLIIALTHSLWAEDLEDGTWALLRAQGVRPSRLLGARLLLRGGSVLLVLLGLIAFASVWPGLPADGRVWQLAALAVASVAVWLGLAALVASLRRSSEFSLLLLLALWLVLAVIGPSLVSIAAAARYPLPEALALTAEQRQGYHASWDEPVPDTMERFYQRYPEWRGADVPTDVYSNAWYYAMQQAGDEQARTSADAYRRGLEDRHAWTMRAASWLPPATVLLAQHALARTDLDSHLAYLDSVSAFHESLKQFFFPAVFDNRPVSAIDWTAMPTHDFTDTRPASYRLLITALLQGLLLLVAGLWRLRQLDVAPGR